MIMQKNFLLLIAIALSIFAFFLYSQKTPTENIRVGSQAGHYLNTFFPLYVAQQEGFFKDEGLNMTILDLGTTGSTNALISKNIEFSTIIEPAISAKISGADLKVVLTYSNNENFLYSNLSSIKELKGKKMAESCIPCTSYVNFNHLLVENGLNRSDVTVVIIPDVDERIKAFKSGAVDATEVTQVVFKPNETKMQIYLANNSLTSMTGAVVAMDQYVKQNPDTVMKFTRAVAKSVKFIYSNRNVTIELLKSGLNLDNEGAERIYDSIVKNRIYISSLNMSNINGEIQEIAEVTGKKPINATDIVDPTFFNNLPSDLQIS